MTRARYEIVVRGRLAGRLERLIDGFEISRIERGDTHLVGWVEDQAALQGAIRTVSDFGLDLLSVAPCGSS